MAHLWFSATLYFVLVWTYHFSHDSCPHVLSSHIFYVILVRLFNINYKHHPNESYDPNLKQ